MIVEDDANFSYLLLDVARAKGFKGIVVPWGNSVMTLAREFQPDAITLDLHLPDMDGWSVLARLKEDAATRHIPVHIISVDEEKDRGLRQGALSFINKPATKESLDNAFDAMQEFIKKGVRNLLVVEDNADQRAAMPVIIHIVADGAREPRKIDAGMCIEILILGR